MGAEPFQLVEAAGFEDVFGIQCCILLPFEILHDELIESPKRRFTIDHVLAVTVYFCAGVSHKRKYMQVLRSHDAL